MKIIFLDIDGVLNVMNPLRDKYGSLFHKKFVDNLVYIIEKTDAKIVISSTWRSSGLSVMQEMWKSRNLPGEVIDVTKHDYEIGSILKLDDDTICRGDEIAFWLDSHKEVTDYVIIDDDNDFLANQMAHFVSTSQPNDDEAIQGFGLTKDCAIDAVTVLKLGGFSDDIGIDLDESDLHEGNTAWAFGFNEQFETTLFEVELADNLNPDRLNILIGKRSYGDDNIIETSLRRLLKQPPSYWKGNLSHLQFRIL